MIDVYRFWKRTCYYLLSHNPGLDIASIFNLWWCSVSISLVTLCDLKVNARGCIMRHWLENWQNARPVFLSARLVIWGLTVSMSGVCGTYEIPFIQISQLHYLMYGKHSGHGFNLYFFVSKQIYNLSGRHLSCPDRLKFVQTTIF